MFKCPYCSQDIPNNAIFCGNCGNSLQQAKQPEKSHQEVALSPSIDVRPSVITTSEPSQAPVTGATPWSSQTPSTTGDGGGASSYHRLAPGTLLSGGRYMIDKLLATGGMGAVYRAIDTRFHRPCAVKEMLDEFQNDEERNQAIEWFEREARLLLDLNHPCIPRVRDFFVENGKHYLVMDFIEGSTLSDVLEKADNVIGVNGARGVPEVRARTWGRQVCSVLSYLHSQTPPIIFRDLKPSNIMVTDKDEIKLIDFGIARTFQSQRQATILMTIGYAPPEQLLGSPEPRSDLYALGATLHRLLTHHDAANNKPSLYSFPPVRTLRPDVSVAFEQVIMKALSPLLEQRWSDAAEMERAIINLPLITVTPPTGLISVQKQPHPLNPRPPETGSGISTGYPRTPETGNPNLPTTTGPAGSYIAAALGFINANRIEEAYASILKAFALEPNNSLVHRIFGQVFARRKPPAIDQALMAYTRSLQLNPNDPETHKLLADVSLFLKQQPAQAIPGYTQALRLRPNDVEAHQRLGQCYEETNQLELALREYQEAALLAPTQQELQAKIGQIAFRLHQLPVTEYKSDVPLPPPNSQPLFRRILSRFGRSSIEPATAKIPPSPTLSSQLDKPTTAEMTSTNISLDATVRLTLEADDTAIVGNTYVLQISIAQPNIAPPPPDVPTKSMQREIGHSLKAKKTDQTLSAFSVLLSIDILFHKSDNIQLSTEWYKSILYDPGNAEARFTESTFQVIESGHSSLIVDFYYKRRWLRTAKFEFDAVEKPEV